MDERQFLQAVDCRFPYDDRQRCLELARQACDISANAAFAVVDEVSRPPKSVEAPLPIRREVLEYIQRHLAHPLVGTVAGLARQRLDGAEVTVAEAIAAMQRISAHPGQYAALSVAYFSCHDKEGEADREFNRIVAQWEEV